MKKVVFSYIVLLLCFIIPGIMGCGDSEEDGENGGAVPLVFYTIPKNGAKAVPTTTMFVVVFDTDVVPPSVANLTFAPGVSGKVSYDQKIRTLTFKPSSPLSNQTDYSMTINGVSDLKGNSMSPITVNFTTSVPDTAGVKIILTVPEDGQKDLIHDTEISITFSEPVDRTMFKDSMSFSPRIDVLLDDFLFDWAPSGDETIIMFPPPGINPFEKDEEYTIVLSKNRVVDLSGNSMLANYEIQFRTLKYSVEDISNLNFPNEVMDPVWMYTVGRVGKDWVVIWGGLQPKGAPSQNTPSGTITASADGRIQDDVETGAANPATDFTPTITKGNGNRLTYQTITLNNLRHWRVIFRSTSSYLTFDLRSAAGTIPKQYVHIGNGFVNPSDTPFTMKN